MKKTPVCLLLVAAALVYSAPDGRGREPSNEALMSQRKSDLPVRTRLDHVTLIHHCT